VRKTRSIIEELNLISVDRDRNHAVENRGEHLIESVIHLIEKIEANYNEDQAKDLTNRIVNSIRAKDSSKFARGIKKVIKESQREDKNDIT
jgi:hypothetical protein|tara:strand:+ start:3325 stop:3597 length:273 start_codon:yes stop_codon:yes gene_type:complete